VPASRLHASVKIAFGGWWLDRRPDCRRGRRRAQTLQQQRKLGRV